MTSHSAWPVCALIQYIVVYICSEFADKKLHLIFPALKVSMNACMDPVGFSISNKVWNHYNRDSISNKVRNHYNRDILRIMMKIIVLQLFTVGVDK